MKQHLFEQQHQAEWVRFDTLLSTLEKGQAHPADSREFSAAYRRICLHVALAEERIYSPLLIDQLRHLALRGHQQFYQHKSTIGRNIVSFILLGFAQAVRREWRFVLAASIAFFGSFALMLSLCMVFPELIYSVLEPQAVTQMEQMYEPNAKGFGELGARDANTDWGMFAFYIMNNIGIGFQTFASGLLWGLGSLFFLLFNGLYIGAIAGHLTRIGYQDTFWSFVIGHGAFELTAIALAGAAGFKLGWALIAPGRFNRLTALHKASKEAMPIVFGMFFFLLIAAFIEAYWSSITFASPTIKYAVGTALWILVAAYFVLAGRQHAPN